LLSRVYGAIAQRRRQWYDTRPEVRRRLRRPVVSVGSLAVGGSGKTPIVADVATVLVSMGERPALLSRGYRRVDPIDGVVVVSQSGVVKADLRQAGDEPLMLAARLADVSVLVAEDRYLAGRLAEERFGASVHLLDDGFQHLSLYRDIDLLVMGDGDLADSRTLPGGRLREPPETSSRADALVVEAADGEQARALAFRLGVGEAFHFVKALGTPRDAADSQEREIADGTRVLAVAGISKPQSFVDDLRTSGYDVVDLIQVRDHHQYSRKDVSGIADRAASLGVDYVVTTEKDLVRLQLHAPFGFPLLWVPLKVMVQPPDHFRSWLTERLAAARGGTSETSRRES
jgi:tetraacyldisaccharide 4'-kinase